MAICDTYSASLKRTAGAVPGATQTADYKTILDNKDIKAVIIATPTPDHKEVALAALKAGKHVYCEAPLAGSIEDAREIALAAKAAKHWPSKPACRCGPIRSASSCCRSSARARWARPSWPAPSGTRRQAGAPPRPIPEREKALNWRLSKATSLGLIGEIGSHPIDQAGWFMNALPTAVTGFGSINFWKDDRDVPDTVQAVFEFPGDVRMIYDATLVNSFDGEYEMLYGSDAAVMMRESKAWMFKEVDSPLLGWEVYAAKLKFYNETGIALVAGASKPQPVDAKGQPVQPDPLTTTPLFYALTNFLRNAVDLNAAAEDYKASYGEDDVDGLMEHLAKVPGARPPATWRGSRPSSPPSRPTRPSWPPNGSN